MKQDREEQVDHSQSIPLVEPNGCLSREAIILLRENPSGTPKGDALREQLNRQVLFGRAKA